MSDWQYVWVKKTGDLFLRHIGSMSFTHSTSALSMEAACDRVPNGTTLIAWAPGPNEYFCLCWLKGPAEGVRVLGFVFNAWYNSDYKESHVANSSAVSGPRKSVEEFETWQSQPEPIEPPQVEPEPDVPCDFCGAPRALVGDYGIRACALHSVAATVQAERVSRGSVHCPESCAEVLRYISAAGARVALEAAVAAGYRTDFDRKAPPGWARKPDPEPIPLVGSTPHYEWP